MDLVLFQRKVDFSNDAEVQLKTVADIDRAVEKLQVAIATAENECVSRVEIVSNQLRFVPKLQSIFRARTVFICFLLVYFCYCTAYEKKRLTYLLFI